MKKAIGIIGIASLVGVMSFGNIQSKPLDEQATQFTKTYNHDSGYNLIGGFSGELKPVDSGLGVKKGAEIKLDNTNLDKLLIKNFEYAQYRDTRIDKLPDNLKIKISPLMYMGYKAQKIQPYTPLFNKYMPGVDYLTDRNTFLSIQNGAKTSGSNIISSVGYISTVRDVASFVHKDWSELYINIYHTLNENKVPRKLKGFFGGGEPIFVYILADITRITFEHTRYTKYKYNRIRPEELAGRVEFGLSLPKGFDLTGFKNNPSVIYSKQKYGTYLLSQTYPEGSPAHPEYTQGHTALCIAGISTIKKRYDTEYLIDDIVLDANGNPVKNGLKVKVGDALDQVCTMIGIGRVMNGVHFEDSYTQAVPVITDIANKRLNELLK